MTIRVIPCGPAANESEQKSFAHLKSRLISEAGDEEWILLTNLAFSVNHQFQSDEIDIVVVSPAGVCVIEIKHWTAQWINAHPQEVEREAERVIHKARKVGTTLRRLQPDLPHVKGAFLLSQENAKVKSLRGKAARGVNFYSLSDWKPALDFDNPREFTSQQIQGLAQALQPHSAVAIDGSLRRLAGYVDLELQTPKEARFHRIYKGRHPSRGDRVILHLYDLSASDEENVETKAKREFETLHLLQLYKWAPRILDSYQEAAGYPGEMHFFTAVDPAAPTLAERITDNTWTTTDRLTFVSATVRALGEMHALAADDERLVHRNISPNTVLVKHDNTPIFTGFQYARIPSNISVGSVSLPAGHDAATAPPEVQSGGLSAADQRSDVYSLCATLQQLFERDGDELGARASDSLLPGLAADPAQRASLDDIEAALSTVLGDSVALPAPPPARFWTEDQEIRFRDCSYRIVSRLGSGGVGITFKVVEFDRQTEEDLGTYVAKVVHKREMGEKVLKAYRRVKSHLRHGSLSAIHETATVWEENQIVALMTWIPGAPFADYTGVFPLLAEDLADASAEALALDWLTVICDALNVLHVNGLAHGDVSPRNLIVEGSNLVLTDYDFVAKTGDPVIAPGTMLYCSPPQQSPRLASPSDDIYALAASFFHVLLERDPFLYSGERDKTRGLNWEGLNRAEYSTLAEFLDKACHPDPNQRFQDASYAIEFLKGLNATNVSAPDSADEWTDETSDDDISAPHVTSVVADAPVEILKEQRIPWLESLLQSYPGSRWGNRETRGLDTYFASQTYVPTQLEETLLQDILHRRVRLVILCGNAGDGKTALLQHLAQRLGLGQHQSSRRILQGQVAEGPLVRMNLDGSAAWQGRSADELLDEFMAPFLQGPPDEDIVHLLAINDGRLLEWVDRLEREQGSDNVRLVGQLYQLLQQDSSPDDAYVRFISLNQRSLVGGISSQAKSIETDFLARLLDHLFGGEDATQTWVPCQTCSAKHRCEVYRSVGLFGPATLPHAAEPAVRDHARQRLFEALQAVHLRGETHITMRELRAALVYILFGIHHCDDYHAEPETDFPPYWDRAFAPDSPARQGEVLGELISFDPALEAHPQIDRYLLTKPVSDSERTAPQYPELKLAAARRRAYFEWTQAQIEQVARDGDALDLAHGRHIRGFRNLPLADAAELGEIAQQLCRGISRLEDLPPQAHERKGVVPLRITPRTPTETAFWIEKPMYAFRVEPILPIPVEGIERLHRQAVLVYSYRDGRTEERLQLGAELFHLLMELADGYQLGDVSTQDTFAHLSIFVQRLVQEDERALLAWNPMQDEKIYQVAAQIETTAHGPRQRMVIIPLDEYEGEEA